MRTIAWSSALIVGLAYSSASAQTVDLSLNQAAIDAGLDEAALEQSINGVAASELQLGDPDAFVSSMSEALAVSTKGLGVDYASNIQTAVVGAALASGAHESGFRFNKGQSTLPQGGYAAQVSLMAGMNLGLGGKENGFFDRFRVYANGMSLKLPSSREFGGRMYNLGGHLQIKLIGGIKAPLTEWGGIDLTSGAELSGYTFELRSDLPVSAPIEGGDLTWNASGAYEIETTSFAIPVELSTNLRISVVTAYVGGGYDLNTASGTSSISLGGPLLGSIPAMELENAKVGSADLSYGGSGQANPESIRFFGGLQANVLVLKAYGHLNVTSNGGIGGHIGARVAL